MALLGLPREIEDPGVLPGRVVSGEGWFLIRLSVSGSGGLGHGFDPGSR